MIFTLNTVGLTIYKLDSLVVRCFVRRIPNFLFVFVFVVFCLKFHKHVWIYGCKIKHLAHVTPCFEFHFGDLHLGRKYARKKKNSMCSYFN